MARILVTEQIAEAGLERLRTAGHEVDVRVGLSPEELRAAVDGASALVIRSATQVTADVLEAGRELVVVGRAGIGLDNVDVEAATRRGVMVVNAPQSNIVSAAEHTLALLLAQARNVPQAHTALREGRWERAHWQGVELHEKTLGLLGLGRVGRLVAQRAHAFGMRLLAHDKFLSVDRARQLNAELVTVEELFQRSDFVSVHLPKTSETVGLVGKELLSLAKPGLRLVNTARGGIVDEQALATAVADGRIAGAALDVFETEPTTESPLFELDPVVVTPHLGASTTEAQDKAGLTIAEQVQLALDGDFVPFAVNVAAAEASEAVRPFLGLAERLGRLFVGLTEGVPSVLEVEFQGQLADYDTRVLTLAVLKGVFGGMLEEPVSYVNAPRIAEEQGVEVRESKTSTAHDFVNLVTIRGARHSLAGTVLSGRGEHRLVVVDDHSVEIPPSRNMLVVRNDDRPGMLALVTGTLADATVNISNLALGRSKAGEAALMVLSTDQPVPDDVVRRLRGASGIISAHLLSAD